MEYLVLLFLIPVTLSVHVANSMMPLRDNLRAHVVAELDVTKLNKELKEYIDRNFMDQVNQTWYEKVEKAIKDSLSYLKSDIEGRFAGLQKEITAQSTNLQESLRNEYKELNRNLTTKISQRITAQFKNLEDLLVKENTELKNNLTTEIKKLNAGLRKENEQSVQSVLIDCSDLIGKANKSGVYLIHPGESVEFKTYCDMETDGGGWTVFQRRINGQTDFYRGWDDYKNGFGDPQAEFWMGNSKLALMASQRQYELRINLEDFSGATAYAKYSTFSIGNESTKYKLMVNGYSGTAGDSLTYHNNQAFSTKDSDNDQSSGNCAESFKGAWWHGNCHYSNLNGLYRGNIVNDSSGIVWFHWKHQNESLKTTSMMIRKKKIS